MVTPKSRRTPHVPAAQALIRAAGERLTAPRAAVLALLLGSEAALTHHEIEHALKASSPVDRVTVYRVLDWLVVLGLAHRIAGDDRTWRYHANRDHSPEPHAHFTCSNCGTTICLENVAVPGAVKIPKGCLYQGVELTVKGLCAKCH